MYKNRSLIISDEQIQNFKDHIDAWIDDTVYT